MEDIIRGARLCQGDIATYNSQVLTTIKEELKSRDPDVKAAAIIKLFYFYHDGASLEWAAFNVLDLMSSPSANARKIGYTFGPLTIAQSPDAMIMCTNLFKKGIKSGAISDISLALSCLGNICTIELGREVMDSILNHLHHSKPVIRKKAFANLRTIYEENPNIIPQTIEKVVSRLSEEQDASVLATILSLLFTVLEYQPKVHPLLIKPLYSLLEKKKSNWTLIKLLKLFDVLLELEPRLQKKLYEAYTKLFAQITAKSVEIELISTVFKHFKEYEDLYKKACQRLKSFIENSDPNLKTLGLQSLKSLLQNDKEVFEEYYDFLLESFEKGDQGIKMTIAEIFTEYLGKRDTETTVTVMVKALENLEDNYLNIETANVLIKNILTICSKNYYQNIDDCEWFLMNVLMPIIPKIKKMDTMSLSLDILKDFTLRVDEIKELAIQFGMSLLDSLQNGQISLQSTSQNLFVCKNEGTEEFKMSIPTQILETLLFIFGEYSSKIQNVKDFVRIINTLLQIDQALMTDINAPLEICLVKMSVFFCSILSDDNVDDIEITTPGEVEEEDNKLQTVICEYLKDVFKLFKRTLSPKLDRVTFCRSVYMGVLLNAFGLQSDVVFNEEEEWRVSAEGIQKCKELGGLVFNQLKPIKKNAQDMIKIADELLGGEIELSAEEKEMIDAFEKEMKKPSMRPATTKEAKKSSESVVAASPGKGNKNENDDIGIPDEEKPILGERQDNVKLERAKVKREFKVMTDEERPSEVSDC